MNHYENGTEGIQRVQRMPDIVLDCIIRDSMFRLIANAFAYEGENLQRLHALMHDVAEETLARVSLKAPALAGDAQRVRDEALDDAADAARVAGIPVITTLNQVTLARDAIVSDILALKSFSAPSQPVAQPAPTRYRLHEHTAGAYNHPDGEFVKFDMTTHVPIVYGNSTRAAAVPAVAQDVHRDKYWNDIRNLPSSTDTAPPLPAVAPADIYRELNSAETAAIMRTPPQTATPAEQQHAGSPKRENYTSQDGYDRAYDRWSENQG